MKRGLTNRKQIWKMQVIKAPSPEELCGSEKTDQTGMQIGRSTGVLRELSRRLGNCIYEKNQGYLCPVWTDEGLLVAFQIRLDNPFQKRKYVWLSSAKMEKGCSPGSPVSLSGTLKSPVVYVTEGVLKAEAASQRTGQPYLGNPGCIQLQGTGIVTEPIKRTRSKSGH